MKKTMRLALILCFIILSFVVIFALSSCNDVPNDTDTVSSNEGDSNDKDTSTETENVKEYTITFDSNGGGDVESQTVRHGEKANEPNYPTRGGYTFDGWYVENEKWAFLERVVTDNVTLVAKWIAKEKTITFDGNGATSGSMENIIALTDETVILPDCLYEREGYAFVGWSDGLKTYTVGEEYKIGIMGGYEFYAVWKLLRCKIMLMDTDGNPISNGKILITDTKGSEVKTLTTGEDGTVAIDVPENSKWYANAIESSNRYLYISKEMVSFSNIVIFVMELSENQEQVRNMIDNIGDIVEDCKDSLDTEAYESVKNTVAELKTTVENMLRNGLSDLEINSAINDAKEALQGILVQNPDIAQNIVDEMEKVQQS